MDAPRVSVLMSVRNGAAYLREAMDSVFAQSFADFEFILIDNGSTDATPDIIASYGDPRLVVLRNATSLTLTEALNQGLAQAKASYVARLDADDIALPDRLAAQAAFMDAHPDIAALGTAWIEFDETGHEEACPVLPLTHSEVVDSMADQTPMAHPTLMLRTEAARAVGGYPLAYAYGQDYALYLELVQAGHRLANLPGPPLVRIRVHGGQASLDQAWAVLRTRESLDLYSRGGRLPGQTETGRRRNRHRVTLCHLQHGLALWRAGARLSALRQVLKACATDPIEAVRVAGMRLQKA